jgi:hypothetical protein
MVNQAKDTVRHLFEDDLRLLRNPTCQRCDARIRHPLLPWIVGEKFEETPERILFVGKPHRGRPGTILPSGIMDPSSEVDDLWHESWPYWSYTRQIAERLYGDGAADAIALSNLVKCTNVDAGGQSSADATTSLMARSCIIDLGVIWREIERLRPFTIVCYTYAFFRQLLGPVPIALEGTLREITPEGHFVPCRNKRLGWWERACSTPWADTVRLLVVGHPERKARPEFVELLVNWIRPSSRTDEG